MKRIHILYSCYWGQGTSGGDYMLSELLKRWLKNNEYEFVLYTTHGFVELIKEKINDRCRVIYTDGEKCAQNIVIEYFRRTKRAMELLSANCEDGEIIYSPTDIMPDVIPAYKIKEKKNVRWVAKTHHISETFYKRPGNIIANFLSCMQQYYCIFLGKKRADIYLTPSPIVFEWLLRHGVSEKKLRMSGNAVDVDLINASDLEAEQYDAVFLGRLSYSKGILELPYIWERVVSIYPNAKLGIIGRGDEDITRKLEKLICNLKMSENIELLGFLTDEEAYSTMKKSKIFLFTSHEEGWGLSIAEAMVAGLPVVAYELPVFSHVFPEGMLKCELFDYDAMSTCVINLLNDEDLRLCLSEKGKEYVINHYSLDGYATAELDNIAGKM